MFKFIKRAIEKAEADEAARSTDYLISGYREPEFDPDGDDAELTKDPKGGWKVIHDDHHIGWIKECSEDEIEDADEIVIKVKDGSAYVRIVHPED